jgi:NADPH-dependent curcumin reductase CurA
MAPLAAYLNVLGMPGMTAYFGLLDIGEPKEGETVVVSGAAGAVGQLVGQIAKLKGARAIGIAGGAEKCARVVDEFGFDGCVDYKAGDIAAGLREQCPDGIDVYFDNVGGEILDAALAQLARHARVVICGAISQYNATGAMAGPANYMALLVNHATMTGFVVSDYGARIAEGAQAMGEWYASGAITSREHVVEGLELFPETLLKLFSGENDGKLVLAV